MNRKTAIVTGASGAIGSSTAELLAKSGYNVVAAFFSNEQGARALAGKIAAVGGEVSVFRADLKKSEEAKALAGFAAKTYGHIDLLVNNAGLSKRLLLGETGDEDFRDIIGVNLAGVFYLCRETAEYMIARKSGVIVNISSVHGLAGASMESAYSAAKAGVIGLTKALAKELAPSGIRVNCVAPGVIESGMNVFLTKDEGKALKEEIPAGRFGHPGEIAETVLFLAENEYITGQTISPNGGFVI